MADGEEIDRDFDNLTQLLSKVSIALTMLRIAARLTEEETNPIIPES